MPDAFIIDAYNVIRRILTASEASLNSESARSVLEARLRAFRQASGPGTRIFLVYDGELGLPQPARREKGFEVYFSKPPRKADDVVLDLAQRHEGERGVHVVTSDFSDIAHRVRGLRVKHLTSQEFAELLAHRVSPKGARGKGESKPGDGREEAKPESISSTEVDAWLKTFGFDGSGGSGSSSGSGSEKP